MNKREWIDELRQYVEWQRHCGLRCVSPEQEKVFLSLLELIDRMPTTVARVAQIADNTPEKSPEPDVFDRIVSPFISLLNELDDYAKARGRYEKP